MPPLSGRLRSSSSCHKHLGFSNLGNTCFFNSALQCLLRVRPLVDYCLGPEFSEQLNRRNPHGSKGRIASAFRQLAETMSGESGPSVNPSSLHSEVCSRYRRFGNFGQHDAQELLVSLLDAIHEDLNQAAEAGGGLPKKELSSEPDAWEVHLARNASPVVDWFHGCLGSSIECPKCGFKKLVRDPFEILSVAIPNRWGGSVTLRSCLEAFEEREVLDRNNQWRCDKCNQLVQATKQMGIHECSKILIVHLKRFEETGYSMRKITTAVDYDDRLDMGQFTTGRNGGTYILTGAVFHSGTMAGGRYTSAVLDQSEDQWYYYNDSHASAVSRSEAHSSSAYILFYERV
jgi:ubiquitin C-terminal hydrolase